MLTATMAEEGFVFVFSSAALAACLLASYLGFVLMEIPYLGGSG